jgi:hypothetical protein
VQHVACSRKRREMFRVLVIKPEGEILEDRRVWDDTIKMNLQEIAWEVVDLIHLSQDGDLWRAVVYMVLHLRAS